MPPTPPPLPDLLAAAVDAVGGAERPGQVAMAEAVAAAIRTEEHVAVQAGTGTGKSLAYLVPALRHAVAKDATVVVSTATIALQRQLVDRDLPRLAEALTPLLGRAPKFAILKGRRNYLCLHRIRTGAPDEPEDSLFDPSAVSTLGKQVQRLHEWAETTDTGDRDELVPGVSEQAWRQVAVSAKECLGASRCPSGVDCFAEQARDEAGRADVVVTNHALLAIDALEHFQVLPEHDVVIIDEAHDLVDRVTSVAAGELTPAAVATAARRAARLIDEDIADHLAEAGEGLGVILGDLRGGKLDVLPQPLEGALAGVRDTADRCIRAVGPERREDADGATARQIALAALNEVHDTAVRLLEAYEPELTARTHVVWLDEARPGEGGRRAWPATLHVAPLGVGGLLRERLFAERTTVLTSATLTLGGSFDTLARQWGLPSEGQVKPPTPTPKPANGPADAAPADAPADGPADAAYADGPADGAGTGVGRDAEAGGGVGRGDAARGGERRDAPKPPVEGAPIAWRGLDVGSPFDHPRSGILYVAKHLPAPGRDGLTPAFLDELTALVEAAGGRTLGLFSSMRAAKQAAEELRDRVDHPILCQGDDSTALLVREFAEDEGTCLFGTLSLWQGVDVPGSALQLVVIDRIPFPRPDDPLASARQRAVAARGGNGFMTVAASHAALLLAQGAGRLLRRMDDKGVVAVLDSRLATARYAGFLRASLPPFWPTTDPDTVRKALHRLATAAQPSTPPASTPGPPTAGSSTAQPSTPPASTPGPPTAGSSTAQLSTAGSSTTEASTAKSSRGEPSTPASSGAERPAAGADDAEPSSAAGAGPGGAEPSSAAGTGPGGAESSTAEAATSGPESAESGESDAELRLL